MIMFPEQAQHRSQQHLCELAASCRQKSCSGGRLISPRDYRQMSDCLSGLSSCSDLFKERIPSSSLKQFVPVKFSLLVNFSEWSWKLWNLMQEKCKPYFYKWLKTLNCSLITHTKQTTSLCNHLHCYQICRSVQRPPKAQVNLVA